MACKDRENRNNPETKAKYYPFNQKPFTHLQQNQNNSEDSGRMEEENQKPIQGNNNGGGYDERQIRSNDYGNGAIPNSNYGLYMPNNKAMGYEKELSKVNPPTSKDPYLWDPPSPKESDKCMLIIIIIL